MGLLSGASGGAGLLYRSMKPQYVCTILLGVSIVVYCCFAFFSIGVIDSRNDNPRPPWSSLQSPMRFVVSFSSCGLS